MFGIVPSNDLGFNPAYMGVTLPEFRSFTRFKSNILEKSLSVTMALLLGIIFSLAPSVLAQSSEKPGRKVISVVKPGYPQTLKDLHIEGLVRLKATVLPNGSVGTIQVIGGNPILVENAIKAVKNWKYAPAPSQTEEPVVLNFFDR
jgi:TonB family protein